MEKAEPPKIPGSKEIDKGDKEGKGSFGTEDLWRKALKKFQDDNKIAAKEMEDLDLAGDLGKGKDEVEKATELFKTWRHPPNRTTKVMVAVSGCLGWVDTAAGFIQEHASGTYATPAKIITGSISKMIKAAKDVSEDFNLIEKTFETIHEAINNVGLLDTKNEKEDHFIHRLVDIFIALFDFCYFSAKMFETSRRRRYIRALLKGRNEKIQEKCGKVEKVILLFGATVPFKILSVAEKSYQEIHDMPNTISNSLRKVIQELKPSDLPPLSQRDSNQLEKVKKRFGIKPDDMSLLESHLRLIKSNYVKGTFSWLKDDSSFKDWYRAPKTPFLSISGPSGTGKSYCTYCCYQLLQEMTKPKALTTDGTKMGQNTSVACFFFDPGSGTRSLENLVGNLIVQIASQDAKFCASLSKDIDNEKRDPQGGALKLWNNFLAAKFEKTPESSRVAYILLDGVDLLDEADLQDLLDLFQDLGCDKTALQIMMTTSFPEKLKMNPKPCEIKLVERREERGDIPKIIQHRIKSMNNLKGFSKENHNKILEQLASQSDGVLSFIDLTLNVMNQIGNESEAMKQMDGKYSLGKLYDTMIKLVMERRSARDTVSVPTLFAWCTYAKEPLSVHELEQIWKLDSSLDSGFDVLAEILDKSKNMLYTTKRVSVLGEPNDDEQPTEEASEDPKTQRTPSANTDATRTLNNSKLRVVEFCQSALKLHLANQPNKMIGDPLKAKVQIFTTLCSILCDSSSSEEESRKALHKYAVSYFLSHLLDIDHRAKASGQESDAVDALSRTVVDGLSRVFANQNNVCSIFEDAVREKKYYSMGFPLYDDSDAAKRILAWAKKMSFLEDDDLTDIAKAWIETTIKDPGKMFEMLARGHVENLCKKVVADQAWEPFLLAFRALYGKGRRIAKNDVSDEDYFDILSMGEINVKGANAIIEFSKSFLGESPVDLAGIRIALALLLNSTERTEKLEARKMAAGLYKQNLESADTPGPEKFYSYVGLAEYYSSPIVDDETQEVAKARWENVVDNSNLALQQRLEEKEALGSELDNERCTMAYWLKADAQHQLDKDQDALKTCVMALAPGELEYSKKNTTLLEILTLRVTIHAKRKSREDYFAIIALIQRCQSKIRAEWMWYRSHEKESLRMAAVMTRRVDFLSQVYEEAIAYHRNNKNWIGALFLTIDLSSIYRHDARVTKMAEITLDNLMKEAQKDISKPDASSIFFVYYTVFPQMVDLLYENYHEAKSQKEKDDEARKLRQLIEDPGTTAYIDQIILAKSLLTLAKMLRGIGKIREAKLQANRAFNICMEDLQDAFTYNDYAAFRLLGKILVFAELEIDAQIALSLQFSEVDRTHEDSRIEPTEAAPTNNDAAFVKVNGIDNNLPSTTAEPPKVQSDQNVVESEPNGDTKYEAAQGSRRQTDQNDPNPEVANSSTHEPVEESQRQPDNSVAGLEAAESSKEGAAKPPRKTPNGKTQNPWSENLIPKDYREIICNGPCGSRFDNFWEGDTNIYFCADCNDVDFCSDCYAEQVRYYAEMGEGFWYKCCWAKHKYIKQPVEGWRGVKDGVIRIGPKQKSFKLWLQAVKDKWNAKLAAITE